MKEGTKKLKNSNMTQSKPSEEFGLLESFALEKTKKRR